MYYDDPDDEDTTTTPPPTTTTSAPTDTTLSLDTFYDTEEVPEYEVDMNDTTIQEQGRIKLQVEKKLPLPPPPRLFYGGKKKGKRLGKQGENTKTLAMFLIPSPHPLSPPSQKKTKE